MEYTQYTIYNGAAGGWGVGFFSVLDRTDQDHVGMGESVVVRQKNQRHNLIPCPMSVSQNTGVISPGAINQVWAGLGGAVGSGDLRKKERYQM